MMHVSPMTTPVAGRARTPEQGGTRQSPRACRRRDLDPGQERLGGAVSSRSRRSTSEGVHGGFNHQPGWEATLRAIIAFGLLVGYAGGCKQGGDAKAPEKAPATKVASDKAAPDKASP